MRKRLLAIMLLALLAALTTPATALADDGAARPRPGRYNIQSYGRVGTPPLHLGHVVLEAGGVYKAFLPGDKPAGEGKYEFDAGKKAVVWKTGPYEKQWGGEFTIDREGKTHKIRLARTTIAVNSTDSQK